MGVNRLTIDIHLPVFTGRESEAEQIRMIREFLFMLTEQLNYTLENLGSGNWNDKELQTLKDDIVAEVLRKTGTQ